MGTRQAAGDEVLMTGDNDAAPPGAETSPQTHPEKRESSRSKPPEGVRSFDSEGVLFRRKWKEKSVDQRERHFPWTSTRPFVAKAKTKDGLTQTKIVRVESEKPETVLWRTPTPPLFPKGTIKPSENYRKLKEKSPDGGREQPAERSRCRRNRSACTPKKKKPTVFKPVETTKEGAEGVQTKIVRIESEKPETIPWRTPTPPLFPKRDHQTI